MRTIGTICARGGSKGIKNKNIKLLLGKPLISYTINALKAWGKLDRIVCSTDSEEIKKIANKYGVETPFTRPEELATDTSGKLEVIQHAVHFCEEEENNKYDFIIDLDPTSPLRTINNINDAFQKLINSTADILLSVYKAHKNPYFNMLELNEKGYAHLSKKFDKILIARQQAPIVYSANASIYVYRRDYLMNTKEVLSDKTIIYEMSDISIDIDKEIDLEFIEFIIKKGLFKFDY